jgi:uncharacterized protein (DUF1800 family)
VAKNGALIADLDNHTSNRIHPNENFARELLELFTLGEGHYSEADVKDVARAFTGWTFHFAGTGLEIKDYEQYRAEFTRHKMAVNNFCFVPALHDDGEKTVLGKKGRWSGEDVLDLLANHPTTIRHITGKLWTYYAGTKITPDVERRLAKAWTSSGGEIRAILKAIADSPEFYAPECVRQMPKSPVDWTVGLFRDFGLGDLLLVARGNPKSEFAPLNEDLKKAAGGLFYLMQQQGMTLLRPPDVAGWEWGFGWASSANVPIRLQHAGIIFWGDDPKRPLAMALASMMKTQDRVSAPQDVVRAFGAIFDIPVQEAAATALTELCGKLGGVGALDNPDSAANLFAQMAKVMFAMPDYHLM